MTPHRSILQLTRRVALTALLVGSSAASAFAQAAPASDLSPRDALLRVHPEVRVAEHGPIVTIYGQPMTTGETALDAASSWLDAHRDALSREESPFVPQFAIERAVDIQGGRATVFALSQFVGDVPVEDGIGRIVVRPTTTGFRVVYAAAKLASPPLLDPSGVSIDRDAAARTARTTIAGRRLNNWRDPVLVVLRDHDLDDDLPSLLAWKVTGERAIREDYDAASIFVDAETGQIAKIASEVFNVDVEGSVDAYVSPGLFPNIGSNPPVLTSLDSSRVQSGAVSAFTASDGTFTLDLNGAGPYSVIADLVGPWVQVLNDAGAEASATVSLNAGANPAIALTTPTAGANVVSQVNAFVHTISTHDFYKGLAPTFTGLDIQIPTFVNIVDFCNAFFSGFDLSTNFFQAGGGCVNTAYSSVVAHEYGHFIVNRLGLAQGPFGEGFSDVVSAFQYDDSILGRGFEGGSTAIRNINTADVTFPCSSSSPHFCGQVLGRAFWDIREDFGALFGEPVGLDTARQLWADWSQITLGGIGTNPIHPATAIELLVADDNDLTLDNGTPNFTTICDAMSGRGIACPAVPPVLVSLVSEPGFVSVNAPATEIVFDVEEGLESPVGNAVVELAMNGGPFLPITTTLIAPGRFSAQFPIADCGDSFEYRINVPVSSGTFQFPTSDPLSLNAAEFLLTIADHDFEQPSGWVSGDGLDTATAGVWTRGDPNGTAAQPENDNSPGGQSCWFTGQGSVGGSLGQNDVDDGQTTLLSPIFDLSAGDGRVEYFRWFSNDTGANPGTDTLRVEISNLGGIANSWSLVELVGPTTQASGGWIQHSFMVSDFVTPSDQVRIRFIASDNAPGSLVEAAIDDFTLEIAECSPPREFLRGDIDGSGTRDLADAIALLTRLFVNNTTPLSCEDSGDANDDGSLSIADAILILDAVFAGPGQIAAPTTACAPDPTDSDTLGCETATDVCN